MNRITRISLALVKIAVVEKARLVLWLFVKIARMVIQPLIEIKHEWFLRLFILTMARIVLRLLSEKLFGLLFKIA